MKTPALLTRMPLVRTAALAALLVGIFVAPAVAEPIDLAFLLAELLKKERAGRGSPPPLCRRWTSFASRSSGPSG